MYHQGRRKKSGGVPAFLKFVAICLVGSYAIMGLLILQSQMRERSYMAQLKGIHKRTSAGAQELNVEDFIKQLKEAPQQVLADVTGLNVEELAAQSKKMLGDAFADARELNVKGFVKKLKGLPAEAAAHIKMAANTQTGGFWADMQGFVGSLGVDAPEALRLILKIMEEKMWQKRLREEFPTAPVSLIKLTLETVRERGKK